MSQNNRDIGIKTIFITLMSAVFLVLIYNVLSSHGTGIITGLYYGQGINFNGFITTVLVIAVKLLWLIFGVSLIVGLIIFLRKNLTIDRRTMPAIRQAGEDGYTCPCCATRLTAEFKFCPHCKASLKDLCVKCGRELQVGWRCCPICGSPKRV